MLLLMTLWQHRKTGMSGTLGLIGIWNSSNFDRPRREMLKAVIANSRQDHRKAFPKLIDDMTWVLQRRLIALSQVPLNVVSSPG